MADVIEIQENLLLPEPEKKAAEKKRERGMKKGEVKNGKTVPAQKTGGKAQGLRGISGQTRLTGIPTSDKP
jgi:hypothetical protein